MSFVESNASEGLPIHIFCRDTYRHTEFGQKFLGLCGSMCQHQGFRVCQHRIFPVASCSYHLQRRWTMAVSIPGFGGRAGRQEANHGTIEAIRVMQACITWIQVIFI